MTQNAQRMVLHPRTPANVPEDEDLNRIVFGRRCWLEPRREDASHDFGKAKKNSGYDGACNKRSDDQARHFDDISLRVLRAFL